MRTKLTAVLVGLLLLAACGGGNGGEGGRASGSPAGEVAGDAPAIDAKIPDDVEEAPDGGANKPPEGRYTYTLATKTTNAATPDAPPKTSPPDASWTSTITYEGDVVVQEDKLSTGPGVSTVKRRWDDDAVRELSFGTKTPQGEGSCTFDEPVVVLELPIEEGTVPTQKFKGEGTNCNGERKIAVVKRDDAIDANGHVWPTWLITVETTVKGTGITSRAKDSRWFSPDLGKDIRDEGITEYINPSGGVAARAETEIVLAEYPTT